jgi:hypothetical protein
MARWQEHGLEVALPKRSSCCKVQLKIEAWNRARRKRQPDSKLSSGNYAGTWCINFVQRAAPFATMACQQGLKVKGFSGN